MTEQSTSEAIAEVWKLFRETDQHMRESDALFRKELYESHTLLREELRESDARLSAQIRETDARLDKRFRATDNQLRRLEGIFTTQWGRLLEALVKPGALRLFRERGVDVHRVHERSKVSLHGDTKEIDLILENDIEVVVVEVKTTLSVADVNEFLQDLAEFPNYFPVYRGFRVYGAVAAITIDENADRYAYKQGLFVLGLNGDGMVEIRNDDRFRPQNFNPDPNAHHQGL